MSYQVIGAELLGDQSYRDSVSQSISAALSPVISVLGPDLNFEMLVSQITDLLLRTYSDQEIETVVPLSIGEYQRLVEFGVKQGYIAVDPAAGGKCEMVIEWGFWTEEVASRRRLVLCGMEASKLGKVTPTDLINACIGQIRSQPEFRNTVFTVYIEANWQDTANKIAIDFVNADYEFRHSQGWIIAGAGHERKIDFIYQAGKHGHDPTIGIPTVPGKMRSNLRDYTKTFLRDGRIKLRPTLLRGLCKQDDDERSIWPTIKKVLMQTSNTYEPYDPDRPGKVRKSTWTAKSSGNDDRGVVFKFLVAGTFTHSVSGGMADVYTVGGADTEVLI